MGRPDHMRATLLAQSSTDSDTQNLGAAYLELREWIFHHLGGEAPAGLDLWNEEFAENSEAPHD